MAETYRNLVEIPERGYHYFRHYFIPHEGNNHHPLVVRPKALKVYSAALIGLKVFLTIFLYTAYPTPGQFAELTASKIFELTNASRVESGQSALKLNATLSRAAKAKAQDMLRLGYFDHTGPDGKKFWQWIKEAGYGYTTAGENLAMDFTTAESAHRALMASTSHRNNILKTTYTDVGFAVAEGTMDGRQTTVLVEYFGTPSAAKRIAQNPTTPTTQPNPTPTAQAATTKAAYAATLVGTNEEEYVLLPGSEVTVWVDFKNTGSQVWRNDRGNFLALNVTNPAGRTSAFLHPSWIESYRPAILQQQSVKPGQTGRFAFTIKAPKTITTSTESFGIVAENLTWVPGGDVRLPIRVVTPQPVVAAGQTPEEILTPQEEVAATFNTTAVEVLPDEELPSVQPTEEQPQPLVVSAPVQPDWQRQVVSWTIRFFWAFLIFLTVSLLLTILVRARVQHRHVILQTVLVLVLTAFMLVIRFHVAERIADIVVI